MLNSKILIVIWLILYYSFFIYSQAKTTTTTLKPQPKSTTTTTKSKPTTTIAEAKLSTTTTTIPKKSEVEIKEEQKRLAFEKEEKEKRERSLREKEAKKKNKFNKLNEDIKKTKNNIANLKKELAGYNKQIETINNTILGLYDKEKIKVNKEKMDAIISKKITVQLKIKELEFELKKMLRQLEDMKDKFVEVDGTLNWKYNENIRDKKKYVKGTWSVTVKAKDDMENWSDEKAMNIIIDPDSDKPFLTIINPQNMARVPGNLTIVGTAYDDDKVGKIIYYIEDLNGNLKTEKITAKGTDFWYDEVDTSLFNDGIYVIKAKVYDEKGVENEKVGLFKKDEISVKFQLDRKTPFIDIKNMKSGDIVSGKLNISGEANDDNGIVNVEYSIDERKTFFKAQSIKRKDSKTDRKVIWNVNFDAKLLVDGTQTIWFRAVDRTGSVGYAPLTVIVDHKLPDILLQYPKDKDTVDSKFIVYGFASDNVELKKVSMTISGSGTDNKPKEVKLLPGNPFWSHPVDMSKYNAGMYKLNFEAMDVAGNKVTTSVNVKLDTEIDKPVLKLQSLKKDERVTNSLTLFGDASDDDGMKLVNVVIKKEGIKDPLFTKDIVTSSNFSTDIDLTDITKFPDGKYSVELTPVDINDTKGKTVSETFWIDRDFPDIDLSKIEINAAGKYFKDNIEISGIQVFKKGALSSFKVSIIDFETDKELTKTKEIKFQSKKEGIYEIDPISFKDEFKDVKFSERIYKIKFSATDFLNRTANLIFPVILDLKKPNIKLPVIDSKTGMMKDDVCIIEDNLFLKSVKIDISSSDKNFKPITGQSLPFNEEKEFQFKVKSADGKDFYDYTINIVAVDICGQESKEQLKVFFKDTKANTHKITFKVNQKETIANYNEPKILLEKERFALDEINSTIFMLLPQSYSEPKFKILNKDISGTQINKEANIYQIKLSEDDKKLLALGENICKISAKSESGENDLKNLTIINDLSDPYARILWPPSNLYFNNSIKVYGFASDDNNEVFVQYIFHNDKEYKDVTFEDIKNIKSILVNKLDPLKRTETESLETYLKNNNIEIPNNAKLFSVDLPLSSLKEGGYNLTVKIRDKVNKEVIKKFSVIYDKTGPKLSVWTPKEKESVNGQITIRGDAYDNLNLSNIVILFNGKEVIADGRFKWETLYNINDLAGINLKTTEVIPHNIELFGIDFAGNKTSLTRSVNIDIKTDNPEVFINSPAVEDQRFTDIVELAGIALDDDGVAYVQYRIDSDDKGSVLDPVKKPEAQWVRIDMTKGNPNWGVKLPKKYFFDPSGKNIKGRHWLEVQAIDIYGAKSEIKSIHFHVDDENPQIRISSPITGSYLSGETVISGRATDPNDIAYVEISTNYGWTYARTEGDSSWKYYFDSRSVPNGQLRVMVHAYDKAGSEAYTFALYNIDNQPPDIDVLLPKDGARINGKFRIVGRAKDNIGIESVKLYIDGNELRGDKGIEGTDMDPESPDYKYFNVSGDSKEAWYFDLDTNLLERLDKYQMIARVRDFAGNVTEKSINFFIDPASDFPEIILDQPQPNQYLTGEVLEFFGTVKDDDGVEAIRIKIDDGEEVNINLENAIKDKFSRMVLWKYHLSTVNLTPGMHKVIIIAVSKERKIDDITKKEEVVASTLSRTFFYSDSGPVIEVLSHQNGAPMEHRPWLKGTTYYYEKDLDMKIKKMIQDKKYDELKQKYRREPEKLEKIDKDKIQVSKFEIETEKQAYLKENRIKDVYLSLDNGKTYTRHLGTPSDWITRVQTQYLKDGQHVFQIKAVTENNKYVIKYFRSIINRQVPEIIIDTPMEGTAINEELAVRGSADDDGTIQEVKLHFRMFDKNLGKTPKFIEGLYLWLQAFGGPTISGGFGLSFFDDVVRVEGMFSWVPDKTNMMDMGYDPYDQALWSKWGYTDGYRPRFYGFAAGGKLLARIIDIPWEFFFGEDAEQFSLSVEIGAAYYWFSGYSGSTYVLTERYPVISSLDDSDGLIYNDKIREKRKGDYIYKYIKYDVTLHSRLIAGFMYQIDLFKVENFSMFRKFAIYFEHGFFFNASEIEGGITPAYGQLGVGIRNGFFEPANWKYRRRKK